MGPKESPEPFSSFFGLGPRHPLNHVPGFCSSIFGFGTKSSLDGFPFFGPPKSGNMVGAHQETVTFQGEAEKQKQK